MHSIVQNDINEIMIDRIRTTIEIINIKTHTHVN